MGKSRVLHFLRQNWDRIFHAPPSKGVETFCTPLQHGEDFQSPTLILPQNLCPPFSMAIFFCPPPLFFCRGKIWFAPSPVLQPPLLPIINDWSLSYSSPQTLNRWIWQIKSLWQCLQNDLTTKVLGLISSAITSHGSHGCHPYLMKAWLFCIIKC